MRILYDSQFPQPQPIFSDVDTNQKDFCVLQTKKSNLLLIINADSLLV